LAERDTEYRVLKLTGRDDTPFTGSVAPFLAVRKNIRTARKEILAT